jgi:hypothetical protein
MSTPISPAKRGWAVGLTATASMFLILAGSFQFFEGLAAVVKGSAFVATEKTIYEFDVTAWGWIHLILGIVLVAIGFFLLGGAAWARVIGIVLAVLSAIANFMWIPYQPIWSILVILLCVGTIWALTVIGQALDD